MNKYLIVDLLPSEWNKVNQWLLTALPKISTKVNKLSQDLLEDKISTSLRKTPKNGFISADTEQTLELLEAVLAPRELANSSTQTEPDQEMNAAQENRILIPTTEMPTEQARLIQSLSSEVSSLKETLSLRDAEILRSQLVAVR